MPHRLTVSLAFLWLSAVCGGVAWFDRYASAPGAQAPAPTDWAGGGTLPRVPGRDTLVMVIHPQCPCSRAGLAELDRLMAGSSPRVTADVVFVRYAGVTARWTEAANWRRAAAIPGVHVLTDRGGVMARRLGALTSGQMYLYGPAGRLLFQGGLTGGRGEEGDNVGLDAVTALLAGRRPARTRTPVFGCPLFAGGGGQASCPARN